MSDITKFLGQSVDYTDQYNPNLLVKELRQTNRESINFTMDGVTGYDRWNIYEVSFLTDNGLPVTGVGSLIYPASNEYIVESKSIKLYFFSYNMTKMGDTVEKSINNFKHQVVRDLSNLLGVKVKFSFFNAKSDCVDLYEFQALPLFDSIDSVDGVEDATFNVFNEDKSLLKVIDEPGDECLTSSLLRSNCKVTHQPDWGDIFIYYKGPKTIDKLSLLQYIVSFRGENHFHEEICETAFSRLMEVLNPDELMVYCLYTRRGGIDINPVRATDVDLIPAFFIDSSYVVEKTFRQ